MDIDMDMNMNRVSAPLFPPPLLILGATEFTKIVSLLNQPIATPSTNRLSNFRSSQQTQNDDIHELMADSAGEIFILDAPRG